MKLAKDYRAQAWETLNAQFGMTVLVTLAFLGILYASSFAFGLVLVGAGPLFVGYYTVLTERHYGRRAVFTDLFLCFRGKFVNAMVAGILKYVFTFLWTLLLIVPGVIKMLSYSMTFFIAKDNPNLSGPDCLARSEQIMKGHKMQLFRLWCSFLGWFALCVVTGGVLCFIVVPYYRLALTAFYEDICDIA